MGYLASKIDYSAIIDIYRPDPSPIKLTDLKQRLQKWRYQESGH